MTCGIASSRTAEDATSGVDLTFATHLAAGSRSECQIQNSTRSLYLLVVLDSNIRKGAR